MFITLEGCEGAGKSTQGRLLVSNLAFLGVPALYVREPGGTPLGEDIRKVLFQYPMLDPVTQSLLFNAARSELVRKVIRSALAEGRVVVSDRYVDSSLVIQGQDIQGVQLRSLCHIATGGLTPDLTIYLDVDPSVGLARRRSAGDVNHFDERSVVMGERYRQAYWELMVVDPARWRCVDAARSKDLVALDVLRHAVGHPLCPLPVDPDLLDVAPMEYE
jgi:dTMP kinase